MDIVGNLPVELGRFVLGWLSGRDLATASMVSVFWRELANDNALWRRLLLSDGFPYETLVPLPEPDGVSEEDVKLEEECYCKRLYNRARMCLVALRRNRGRKSQVEGSFASPMGNGQLLASISSRKPYINLYDLLSSQDSRQIVPIPRIKCSIQMMYASHTHLVLEMFPTAFICYRLRRGVLEMEGVVHAGEEGLRMEKEYDEGGSYTTGGASILRLIEDTMILKKNDQLSFVCIEPFKEKAKVTVIPLFRCMTMVLSGRFFLVDPCMLACFDKNGKKLLQQGSDPSRSVWGREVLADGWCACLVLYPPVPQGGAGPVGASVTAWGWGETPVLSAEIPFARSGLCALGPLPFTFVHCTTDSLTCTDLSFATTLWSVLLDPDYLHLAFQFTVLASRFIVIRTENDYSLYDVNDGRYLFRNTERPECSHIHRHNNPRAFVFHDALFARIILHVFI